MKEFLNFSTTIKIRMLINFFAVFTTAMVMPYMIIYFTKNIGITLTTIMIMVVGVISLVGYIIGGIITDAYGRKIVIIIGEIITGIGFLIITYLDSLDIFYTLIFLIVFAVIYFFESAANPAYSALIIDASHEKERKTIYSFFIWITSIAFALGSVIGGFYFEQHSTILFLIMSITSFVASILTFLFIKDNFNISEVNEDEAILDDNEKVLEEESPNKNNIFSIFFYRLFLYLCIGTFFINVISEQLYNYIPVHLVEGMEKVDYTITGYEMVGFLHLEDTIIMSIAVGVILKLTKNFSEMSTLILGMSLNLLGYIILSYFLNPFILFGGMFIISIGFLIYRPVEQTIIANAIPDNSRGKHLSIIGLMGSLGGMMSSLFIWASKYLNTTSITIIFIIVAIITISFYIKAAQNIKSKILIKD